MAGESLKSLDLQLLFTGYMTDKDGNSQPCVVVGATDRGSIVAGLEPIPVPAEALPFFQQAMDEQNGYRRE